jgi:hypothetical protein
LFSFVFFVDRSGQKITEAVDGSCQTVVLLFYVLLILSTVIGTAMSATRLTSGSQQNLNVSVNSSASTKGTINCLEKSLSRHVWSA